MLLFHFDGFCFVRFIYYGLVSVFNFYFVLIIWRFDPFIGVEINK